MIKKPVHFIIFLHLQNSSWYSSYFCNCSHALFAYQIDFPYQGLSLFFSLIIFQSLKILHFREIPFRLFNSMLFPLIWGEIALELGGGKDNEKDSFAYQKVIIDRPPKSKQPLDTASFPLLHALAYQSNSVLLNC